MAVVFATRWRNSAGRPVVRARRLMLSAIVSEQAFRAVLDDITVDLSVSSFVPSAIKVRDVPQHCFSQVDNKKDRLGSLHNTYMRESNATR